MADQTTAVASLPSGYTTLTGAIYAVAATPPNSWSEVAWRKMVPQIAPTNKASHAANFHARNPHYHPIVEVQKVLSKTITKEMRQYRSRKSREHIKKVIVALHILHSFTEAERQGRDYDPTVTLPSSHKAGSDTIATIDTVPDCPGGEVFPKVRVNFVGPSRPPEEGNGEEGDGDVELSITDFRAIITTVDESVVKSIATHTRTAKFVRSVSVQEALPFHFLVIELGYKGIQMLFACAVILGSTGGAWLGLTLSSMFPHRTAAGLYRSSYGQCNSEVDKPDDSRAPAERWRPVGTIWTDGENKYSMPATAMLSDEWRDCLGYWMQYIVLFTFQCFKLKVRDFIGFGPYHRTRDAIRYILLAIEFLALVTMGLSQKTGQSQRTEPSNRPWKVRDWVAFVVYLTMLSAGLTCVILGQKDWLNSERFTLISKVIDPIAAVGSVAAISICWQEDGSVTPYQWILIWAMGACTLVW